MPGIVEAVGAKVKAFEPGDHVFGVTNPRFIGAYAEFAVASAGTVAKKPARLESSYRRKGSFEAYKSRTVEFRAR